MAEARTVVDGKYEILKQIGKGGMSRVYLAMDLRLNKQWAIKEIDKFAGDKSSGVMVQSLIAEANLMKKLDHPALPRIVDIIDQRKTILVIMDYIEGEPLSRLLAREGAQPEKQVIEWGKQICEILCYLHQCEPAIIYRDMKPDNVMVQASGNIKLIDFGIAREYKSGQEGDTLNLGTRGYAAPEQFAEGEQTDARTDIYGLGATMYHLVTGKSPAAKPYEMYPIRFWNPSLSGGLESIIEKCTKKDPQKRYQSGDELLYDLIHYEQADSKYQAGLKKKIKIFFFIAACAMLSFFFGIGSIAAQSAKNRSRYEDIFWKAKQIASSDSEKALLLVEAIALMPDSVEAYEELIRTYRADADFSLEEEAQLKKCLNANLPAILKQEKYPELAFEVGKLYWYYYSYGTSSSKDNRATRVKSAAKWFEAALDVSGGHFSRAGMARIYMEIGNFQSQIAADVEEALDKGKYGNYWKNIERLLKESEKGTDSNEITRLELYKLVIDSIENYSRKFCADGIKKENLSAALETAVFQAGKEDAFSDKTKSLKREIQSRYRYAKEAVENAYLVPAGTPGS